MLSKYPSLRRLLPFTILILFFVVGLWLRFYQIEITTGFGWDQARDSFAVRDILQGKFTLVGPQTGIGHFHLGPAYYYLLAPFFFFSGLDPVGAIYFAVIAFAFNLGAIYYSFSKIASRKFALLVCFSFVFSRYWILAGRVPWNVSLLPGTACLTFYLYSQVASGKTKLLPLLFFVWGFLFQIHFAAIFLTVIFLPLFLFLPKTKKTLKYLVLSVMALGIWFVPNFLYVLEPRSIEYYRLRGFWQDYFLSFHARFLLHRLPDSLIEFEPLISYHPLSLLKYVYPVIFIFLAIGRKIVSSRLFIISIFWLLGPLVGFTFYGGPISDYYFYLTLPAVLLIFWKVNLYFLRLFPLRLAGIILFIWSVWFVNQNINNIWRKADGEGLALQKQSVRETIKGGGTVHDQEGDIKYYLYIIWTKDKHGQKT